MYATRIAFSSGFDDGVAAAAGSRGRVVDARVIFYVEQHARYAGHTQPGIRIAAVSGAPLLSNLTSRSSQG